MPKHRIGPIAQSVEQVAFNHWVAGSSPARITIITRENGIQKDAVLISINLIEKFLIYPFD